MNVQYAMAGGVLYVLEANPRASRTVPFVSKATGVPLAKAAARVMLGIASSAEAAAAEGDGGDLPLDARRGEGGGAAVRAVPAGVDTVLGPEMRSTGEVMGIDAISARPTRKPRPPSTARCRSRAGFSSPSPTGTSGP